MQLIFVTRILISQTPVEERYARTQKRMMALQEEVETLREEREALRQTNRAKDMELEKLKVDMSFMDLDNRALQEQTSDKQKEVECLQKQLDEKEMADKKCIVS